MAAAARDQGPPQAHPKPQRRDRLAEERREREKAILARAEIRHDLVVLSGGRCCACAGDFHLVGFEAHHMVSGSGKRRQHESIETMAPTCVACHRQAHAGDEATLRAILAWADRHGSPLARSEVRRRLEKLPNKYATLAAARRIG